MGHWRHDKDSEDLDVVREDQKRNDLEEGKLLWKDNNLKYSSSEVNF